MLAARSACARAAMTARAAARMPVRAMSSGSGDYDCVVVGGGPGGYVAAIKAAQLGMKVACVESRGALGGTCLNVGCIPSKALLHSSHLYDHALHGFKQHGIHAEGLSVNLGEMMKSKDKAVKGLTGGIESLFKKNKVDYIKGFGEIKSPGSVSVALNDGGNQTVSAKNILIATGSVPSELPPVPVDNDAGRIVDSTGALALDSVPKKMVVIGAGVIGLEMGSVWRRLGAEVEVVEFLDRAVMSLDQELSTAFKRTLEKQGLKFHMSTKVVASEVTDSGVSLTTEPSSGGDQSTIDCDVCLVATGRRPFTSGLGLEGLGIELDRLGRVPVDHEFRTTVPGVWAIGDVIEGPMLAHKAEEEGIAAVENMMGQAGHVNYDAIPNVIYTMPEVAAVGKTEEELKEAGIEYVKGTFPFMANSRARAVMESDGLVKILADKHTDRILGVHIMGPNAGEMIAEGVLGMEYGASAEDIARTCHAHPTLSEAFKEAAMATYSKPIHF